MRDCDGICKRVRVWVKRPKSRKSSDYHRWCLVLGFIREWWWLYGGGVRVLGSGGIDNL